MNPKKQFSKSLIFDIHHPFNAVKSVVLQTLKLLLLGSVVFACTQQVPPPPEASDPVPTERQLQWHEMEQYAFIHFTTNTFTEMIYFLFPLKQFMIV